MLHTLAPSKSPLIVSVKPKSSSEIEVTWETLEDKYANDAVKAYIVSYRIYRNSNDQFSVKPATSTVNNQTLIGLEPGTKYAIRVLAYNENANGIASDEVSISTFGMGKINII